MSSHSDEALPVPPRGFAGIGFVDAIIRLYTGQEGLPLEDLPLRGGSDPRIREAYRACSCWPSRDMAVLWDLVDKLLVAAELPRPARERMSLLELACGRCTEAVMLGAYAGCFCSDPHPGAIRLYGVDIREKELVKARDRCAATQRFFHDYAPRAPVFEPSFRYGDATNLAKFGEIPGEVDWVFLRHQNGWHNVRIWTEIFNQGLSRLAPGGLLFITSYFDREHAMALNMISGLGGRLLASLRNTHSRKLATPGKSVDRHAAVFTREA